MKDVILKLVRKSRIMSDMLAIYRLWRRSSYLRQVGWFDSSSNRMPIDRKGRHIPWFTYGAVQFLEPRIKEWMTVFEYGSGNSTIWWSRRVSQVVSCEHDGDWYKRMIPELAGNVEYVHCDLQCGPAYSKVILRYRGKFDIIVIDGRDRVNCAKNSLPALKPSGIVIWDNSNRKKYQDGYDHLTGNGFKRIDFAGLGPINAKGWCTSIFYRTANWLAI